ncbi:MAG TPA: hypothetical protein VGW33_07360 [Terriglobia bacterium]|nr:hypothetical protein [Terriglobia bacterium]
MASYGRIESSGIWNLESEIYFGFSVCLFFAVSVFLPLKSLSARPVSSPATLTYTRTLQGSVPEFLLISVNREGSGAYEGRALADPSHPVPLQLSAETTSRLFALAAELNDFRGLALESHKKVANLGAKTFTYESGAEKNEVEFNFTERREARELTDLFERIATSEQHRQALDYAIKYDPLSLPKELQQVEADIENRALADPELMVPSLEEIARNPRFLHLAQVRAESILKAVAGDP